jgi:RNA polymerase sigma-70 factor (ECF subfamily)
LIGARQGGRDERSALLERLRPRLLLWVATRLSPALRAKVEPDDVVQEILLAVHQGLDSFTGDDDRALLAWIFTVGENRIRDLADRFGALKRKTPPPLSASQSSPSTAAVRKEMTQELYAALEKLHEQHRRVIQLRRIEERDTPEVARILERSENAVRILYCRALQALRAEMKRSESSSASPGDGG